MEDPVGEKTKILLPGARILRTKRVGSNLGEAVEIPEKTLGKRRNPYEIDDPNSKRARRNNWLLSGAYCDPKEDLEMPLGQDAYFMCMQTIGVADGVGGTMKKNGIDSGVYARQLMDNAYEFLQCENGAEVNPARLLEFAYETSHAPGASTACIITLAGNILSAVNVGDSGFLIIRGEEIVYRSPPQQSGFNRPHQLGDSSRRKPCHAQRIRLEVVAGDIIVAATDGLFDNLFDAEIEDIVNSAVMDDDTPDVIADDLVFEAREVSVSREGITPWTMAAVDAGRNQDCYLGGKYDDITVIVARIFELEPPIDCFV